MFSVKSFYLILAAPILVSSVSWAQFKIEVIESSKKISFTDTANDRENYKSLMILVKKVEQILPARLKNSINHTVTVDFTDDLVKGKTQNNHGIAGKVKGKYKFQLHRDSLFTKSENGHHPLLNTLIHEIAHIYDNLNVHFGEDRNQILDCQSQFKLSALGDGSISSGCLAYKETRTSISTTPAYLQLYGSNLIGFNGERSKSSKPSSEDVNSSEKSLEQKRREYKMTSSKESFAVEFEDFLMDPQFKCKEPSIYKLLSSFLNHTPFNNITCDSNLVYIDSRATNIEKIINKTAGSTSLKEIDFSRVYQIHYLLAAEGEAMMSRWGHSMLRVVICAPERKILGPDCIKDLSHHIVLSFRGLVDSAQIDTIDGLTGKYASRLYFQSIDEVKTEYNRQELRDLVSYPIVLNREQIRDVLTRAVEIFWNYEGKYYFLSNNCAHETFNLIRSALGNSKLNNDIVSTPVGILETLTRRDMVDKTPFNKSREVLKRDGYLFESESYIFSSAFKDLKSALPKELNKFDSFQDFLETDSLFRANLLKTLTASKTFADSSKEKRDLLINRYITFESYILELNEKKTALRISELLSDTKNVEPDSPLELIPLILQKKIDNMVLASNPGRLIKQSKSGIPMIAEAFSSDADIKEKILEDKMLNDDLLTLLNEMKTKDELTDAKTIMANIEYAESFKTKLEPLKPKFK